MKDEQTGVVAASGAQIGDWLSPLNRSGSKGVFPRTAQVAEIAGPFSEVFSRVQD
jgi:hypothetical protein